ncbi:hypothetical protein DER45DRAFT_198151 [Fusarium avenaceum]|nr:hypothetical protein DER45DRAFT_198151 [Fusarium avenaceum]
MRVCLVRFMIEVPLMVLLGFLGIPPTPMSLSRSSLPSQKSATLVSFDWAPLNIQPSFAPAVSPKEVETFADMYSLAFMIR